MQNYSFSTGLRVWHPSIDPAEVTKELAITPQRAWLVGERRSTPKGQFLDGVNRESYWSADPFDRGEYLSTDQLALDALHDVLQVLAPHKAFLQRIRSEGARVMLLLNSYSGRNYAIELPPEFRAVR